MAKKVNEPSYSSLAELAELFGSAVYQAPVMQQSEALQEVTQPKENKLMTGYHTGDFSGYTNYVYVDQLNTIVSASNITGQQFEKNNQLLLLQKDNGEFVIVGGGGRNVDNTVARRTEEAQSFLYSVIDNNHYTGTFRAFDTSDLILVIKSLKNRIDALERSFNMHTHLVGEVTSAAPSTPSKDVTNLDKYISDYEKSHTEKFEIMY